jgi:hypothetical protein
MARSVVVLSGLAFAAMALFGYQLLGWQIDGWILLVAGIVHLAIVLGFYPRLDVFLVVLHYGLALAALGGVVSVLVDAGGAAPKSGPVLVTPIFNSHPPDYRQFGDVSR